MRVRVRLCLNACVSRRMRESWQLWIVLNCHGYVCMSLKVASSHYCVNYQPVLYAFHLSSLSPSPSS